MTPFEAYSLFMAIKAHFNTNYDAFKYNFKMRHSYESFDTRKDRYAFERLAKIPDLKSFLVSNFLHNPKIWVGELLSEECKNRAAEFSRINDSISFNFTEELKEYSLTNFESCLIVQNGQLPLLLKRLQSGTTSIQTVIILDRILNLIPYWDEELKSNILWSALREKIMKTKGFINFDYEKCKKLFDSLVTL